MAAVMSEVAQVESPVSEPRVLQTVLNAEWAGWIHLNLSRGCTPASMVEEMQRRDFDPTFAWFAVNKCLADGLPLSPDLDWKALTDSYAHETSRLPQGNVLPTADWPVKVSLRLGQPCVAVLDNILSHEECDEIIRRSMDKMQRSGTVNPKTGESMIVDERTSEGTFFDLHADAFISRIERRISQALAWPESHGEGLQVLHYLVGGEYKPHFDYFAFQEAGSYRHLMFGGQRVSTLVMYLNEVEAGGATIFPEVGLEVVPKKGSAVYFEYTNSLGQCDPMSLHGGAPVIQGEKWIMTKWMHQREHRPLRLSPV
jgi:prolyl 4-hydroxylase